jgi:glucan phosphoethanolaminetransferase (alkaline phosphatase superfamily)
MKKLKKILGIIMLSLAASALFVIIVLQKGLTETLTALVISILFTAVIVTGLYLAIDDDKEKETQSHPNSECPPHCPHKTKTSCKENS